MATLASDRSAIWLASLANHWQVAAGLRMTVRLGELAGSLQALTEQPIRASNATEALLLRGYLLELSSAIQTAALRAPERVKAPLGEIGSRLGRARELDPPLIEQIRALLVKLEEPASPVAVQLAQRARAYVDANMPRRIPRAEVTRALNTNHRYLDRAFRREFGVSIAAYQRAHRTRAAIGALASAVPVKRAARDAGCTEATLRRLVRQATGQTPSRLAGRAASKPQRRD